MVRSNPDPPLALGTSGPVETDVLGVNRRYRTAASFGAPAAARGADTAVRAPVPAGHVPDGHQHDTEQHRTRRPEGEPQRGRHNRRLHRPEPAARAELDQYLITHRALGGEQVEFAENFPLAARAMENLLGAGC